jgi:hypothetical protein
MATSAIITLPVAATPAAPQLTKFGAVTPDSLVQLQSAFQQDYRADLYLTSAQILALQTGAIQLLPAPGVGLMICPETIVIRVFGLTAAYTDAGGAVSFNIGTMTAALAANTVFTGPTNGQRSQQIFAFNGTSTAAAPPTNENAAMTISKATNNFAAGSGTAHITVFYTIEVANA